MTIRRKLLTLCALFGTLVIAVAAALYLSAGYARTLQRAPVAQYEDLTLHLSLTLSVAREISETQQLMFFENDDGAKVLAEARRDTLALFARMERVRSEEAARDDDAAEEAEIEGESANELREAYEKTSAGCASALALHRAGEPRKALALLRATIEDAYEDSFLELITASIRREQAQIDAIEQSSRVLQRSLVALSALAAIIAVLAAALGARWLVAPISRKLKLLQRATAEVAKGNLAVQAEVPGEDELAQLGAAFDRMTANLQEYIETAREQERALLTKEIEVAQRIQTSVLPRVLRAEGLEIAATMWPASSVGGDYYDCMPFPGGCWLAIGDVAGHGLSAGLVMLMVQSAMAGILRARPDATPSEVLCTLNAVLYDNIRNRLEQDDHVTLTLLRYSSDGRVVFAGAHEEIVIVRRATGESEHIETPGTWLAAMKDIRRATVDTELQLHDGDVMLLYTDGVTEAMNATGEQFEMDRLRAIATEAATEGKIEAIRDRTLEAVRAWMARQDDDLTVLALRYHAP